MRTSRCLDNLPPYLFARIDAKRAAIEATGADVISLGIGDPDMPTPEHVVDAMARAIRDPKNHRYPDYAGSPEFRRACADYAGRRFGVSVDPEHEVLASSEARRAVLTLLPRLSTRANT